MFFAGSLEEGINKSILEQKLVICFITEGGSESDKWETWLTNESEVSSQLDTKAVLLKLNAGSQESQFLTAFCPIDVVPALVVIKGGVLAAHLKSGLNEDEFTNALLEALKRTETQATNISSPEIASIRSRSSIEQASGTRPTASGIVPASPPIPSSTDSNQLPASAISIPAQPASKAKESQDEQKARAKRAAELKKQQSDALAERRRVLRQIENDKLERKRKEQAQKASARAEEAQIAADIKHASNAARKNAKECALKIRTFDGSTISSTFASNKTLQREVRAWIDSELGALDAPYEFKQVLVPMPNRRISASEEEQTLVEMGLAPNATLVMVPVQGYSVAYNENPPTIIGGVGSVLSYGYGLVCGGLSTAGSLVGSLLGGQTSETGKAEEETKKETTTPSSSNVRIRTLADQRRGQEDQQLYNGNQLNFQRRKSEDEN